VTRSWPTGRRRTRAQHRSQRIAAERNRNRDDRLARQRAYGYARASSDDPPFQKNTLKIDRGYCRGESRRLLQ
jgi:hypothetical protein